MRLILLTALVFASGTRGTSEGYRDLIEKAHNLSLQKDRQQAVSILVAGIQRESAGSPAARELNAALLQLSTVFFSDKTLQLYELALSLRKTDLNQALAKLNEALATDSDNLLLIDEQARLFIAKGDCTNAKESMARRRKWNPYDEQTLLTAAQAAICLADFPGYTAIRSQAEGRKGPYSRFWLSLEVERAVKENAEVRAHEALELLHKEDPGNPEYNYWKWRLAKDPARAGLAQKYLMECKNITAAIARRSMMDPHFCRRTGEVESTLKTGQAP